MIKLRPYQQDAFVDLMNEINRQDDALAVIPTGGGKTAIMAYICQYVNKWGGRAIVLSHVKELIEQTAGTLHRLDDTLDVGIHSAGLKRRDTKNKIIVAGIQSAYSRVDDIGKMNVAIIDEAHLIPKNSRSRYRKFINAMKELNPRLKLIGLTATPYRTDDGLIYGEGELFTRKTYEAKIEDLIKWGFLSPLRSKAGSESIDLSRLELDSKGDYTLGSQEREIKESGLLTAAVQDIVEKASDQKKILVFCPTIKSCEDFMLEYNTQTGCRAYTVTGSTHKDERKDIIEGFRNGDIRVLVNCMVLTTGFDAPNVDCVCLLRPTTSAGLYYQMVGRGLRIADGKENCLILDYGRNIERHGAINAIRVRKKGQKRNAQPVAITKKCPQCSEMIPVGVNICPDCGYQFPAPELKIDDEASDKDIIIDPDAKPERTWYDVESVSYTEPKAGKQTGTKYIQVVYNCGYKKKFKQFLGIEYGGYARSKFEKWFDKHVDQSIREQFGGAAPFTCEDFEMFVQYGAIATPSKIQVEMDPKKDFPEVVKEELNHLPTLEEINEKAKAKKEAESNPDSYSYWENR